MKKIILFLIIFSLLLFSCEKEEDFVKHKLVYTAGPFIPNSGEIYDITLLLPDGQLYSLFDISGFYALTGAKFTDSQHVFMFTTNLNIELKAYVDNELIKTGEIVDNIMLIDTTIYR